LCEAATVPRAREVAAAPLDRKWGRACGAGEVANLSGSLV